MSNNKLLNLPTKRVHFIGIGGCSMSGLALILDNMGFNVTGSDLSESSYTKLLSKAGINFTIGHLPENVDGAELVVYTAAVKPDNCEFVHAKEKNIPLMERSTLLGHISELYKTVIGISGCHGKTTITSMLAIILSSCNIDATVHVGGLVKQLNGGIKIGNSDIFLTEACEYVQSFLKLEPSHVLINNIDDDHLDCYKDIKHIYQTFKQFALKVNETGAVFGCGDEPMVVKLLSEIKAKSITYGLKTSNDYYAKNITFDEMGNVSYDLFIKGDFSGKIVLNIPGVYNVVNSLAAISVAHELFNLSIKQIAASLLTYTLTKRRFEVLGERNGVTVIHDYAHHPTEIKVCIDACQHYPKKKLFVVFQCHLYSRAKTLKDKYATAFAGADIVLVPDICGAREKDDGTIHATDLVHAISKNTPAIYLKSFDEINEYIKKHAKSGDVVLTLGPGNVNKLSLKLLQ